MTLIQLLQERAKEIIAEASGAMTRAHLQHYETAGVERTYNRLDTLYEIILRCVEERNLAPRRVYAEAVARQRFESGFPLWEVQTAINVLEEVIWLRILKELQPAQFGEALGLVSTVLGAGKDTLARIYVSLVSKTKAPSLNVQSLFSGTEGLS